MNEQKNEAPGVAQGVSEAENQAVSTDPKFVSGSAASTPSSTPKSGTAKQDGNTVAEAFSFLKEKVFSPFICKIILLVLGIGMTFLSTIQLLCWFFAAKDAFLGYWQRYFEVQNYIQMAISLIVLLFVAVLLVQVIQSIISLLQKKHQPCFAMVATILAFYTFASFLVENFSSTKNWISSFVTLPLFVFLMIAVFLYALIRLIDYDFKERILVVACSLGLMMVSLIAFGQGIGECAVFSVGKLDFTLADINLYDYIISSLTEAGGGRLSDLNLETVLIELGVELENTLELSGSGVIFILGHIVVLAVSKIAPFAALSLLAYVLYGLVSDSHDQYRHLYACRKVSISLLVANAVAFAGLIALSVIAEYAEIGYLIEINYVQGVLVLVLNVLILALSLIPWQICNWKYKNQREKFKSQRR